jgi:DNA replication protein DnaC
MNTETLEKMRRMRLWGMHRSFKSSLESTKHEELTADEMTALLVDNEWDDRHNRHIDRSMKNARFRYKATIEQVDYSPDRGVDRNLLHRLAACDFI